MSTSQNVSRSIRSARRSRGLTVKQLAEMLTQNGTPHREDSLSRMERGDRLVNVNDLVSVASALSMDPVELLTGRSSTQPAVLDARLARLETQNRNLVELAERSGISCWDVMVALGAVSFEVTD